MSAGGGVEAGTGPPGPHAPQWARRALTLALLLGAPLLAVGVGIDHGIQIYDEGQIATGAARVAAGEWPIADFWTLYPPGSYWLLGGLFHLFGAQLLLLRAVHGLVLAAIAWLAGVITARASGRRACGWLGFGLALLFVGGFPSVYGYPAVPAVALVLAAAGLLVSTGPDPGRRLLGAGALCGLAAWFRHDYAALGFAALAAARALEWRCAPPAAAGGALRDLVRLGTGALPLAAAGLLPLCWVAGPGRVGWALLGFPLTRYAAVRGLAAPLPFGSLLAGGPVSLPALLAELPSLLVWWPPLCAAGVLAWSVGARRRGALAPDLARGLWLLALLCLVWLVPFCVRGDPEVQGWALCLAGLLLTGLALAAAWPPARARRPAALRALPARLVLRLVLGLVLAGFAAASLQRIALRAKARYAQPTLALASPRAAGIRLSADQAAYNQLLRRVRAAAAPGACIHSGVADHDRPYVNDALLYFLADRCVPHPYHELHPGVAELPAAQREIRAALERAAVPVVVLLDYEPPPSEAEPRGPELNLVDGYLAREYRTARDFWSYRLLLRR